MSTTNLLQKVREGVSSLSRSEVMEMAERVAGTSFSMLDKIRRDKYDSEIKHSTLLNCEQYLRKRRVRARA